MWKWKKTSSPEVKSCAHKCKLIKSYNSHWHKSLYSRYGGAQRGELFSRIWQAVDGESPLTTPSFHSPSCKSFNYAIRLLRRLFCVPAFYWQAVVRLCNKNLLYDGLTNLNGRLVWVSGKVLERWHRNEHIGVNYNFFFIISFIYYSVFAELFIVLFAATREKKLMDFAINMMARNELRLQFSIRNDDELSCEISR